MDNQTISAEYETLRANADAALTSERDAVALRSLAGQCSRLAARLRTLQFTSYHDRAKDLDALAARLDRAAGPAVTFGVPHNFDGSVVTPIRWHEDGRFVVVTETRTRADGTVFARAEWDARPDQLQPQCEHLELVGGYCRDCGEIPGYPGDY
jgi:hypothetical protein